ncbi:MAG: PKD domain-containing protein [Thermoplasmatota archaeon]
MASLFSVLHSPVHAEDVIYVDSAYSGYSDGSAEKPYKSIQGAIDIASSGDTIYVFGGTYDETLIISKKVTLWGSIDKVPTVIDTKKDERYTVSIAADYVVFQDFTIQDAGGHKSSPIGSLLAIQANNVVVQGNMFNDTRSYGLYIDGTGDGSVIVDNHFNKTNHGIHIVNSDTIDILRNHISNCTTYGVYISSSTNSRLYDNVIESSLTGVAVISSTSVNVTNNTIRNANYAGLHIEGSAGSIVKQNVFENNTGTAFYLDASTSQVHDNNFTKNERGITLVGFSSVILNNTFWNQTASGIYALPNSDANILYKNHFIGNGKSAEDLGDNTWYYQGQGNYYSDYGGIDRALDNIGDTPYIKNGIVDNYPLGYFLKPPNKPIEPSPEDAETSVGLKITFKVTVEDEDSEQMTVYFYQYLQNESDKLIGTDKRVNSGDVASWQYVQGFDTTFLWYAVANDSILENRSDIWYFTTMATPPDNKPPVSDPGGPYIAKPEQIVYFDASQSVDPDGNIEFYRWNFGDGSSEILAKQPTHMYKTVGSYIITLTVIDNNGTSDTESTNVTIAGNPNVHPTADANGPYEGLMGSTVIFSGENSTDTDGEIVSYSWDFGNGFTGDGMIGVQVYEGPGAYLVVLTVTDDAGDSSSAQTTVTITEPEPETPGFELILFMIAGIILITYRKRRYQI